MLKNREEKHINKVLKKILLFVIFLLFAFQIFPSVAYSEPNPENPTLPFYWVKGEVKPETPGNLAPELDGRSVMLFGLNYSDAISAKGLIDNATGTYMANAGELYFYYPDNIFKLNNDVVYVLAIVRDDAHPYGAYGIVMHNNDQGFIIKDLQLGLNIGPKKDKAMVVGYVYEIDPNDPSNKNKRIVNANIGIYQDAILKHSYVSLADGEFIFYEVEPGNNYMLTCAATGYKPYQGQVFNLQLNDHKFVEIGLEKGLAIIKPAGGENWEIATKHDIQWEGAAGIQNVKIEYSIDDFVNSIVIEHSLNNIGVYEWTIPNNPSNNVKIKVSSADNPALFGISNIFTITNPNLGPGPIVDVTLLLEGLNRGSVTNNVPTEIRIELRNADNQANATSATVVASTDIKLDATGNGSNFGWWVNDIIPQTGIDYYLVVMQKIPGVSDPNIGFNHIPIISNSKYSMVNQPAKLTIDFTSNALAYTPANRVSAMKQKVLSDGQFWLLRAGWLAKQNTITVSDFNRWRDTYLKLTNQPDELLINNIKGDGNVDVSDFNAWRDTYLDFAPNRKIQVDDIYFPF